MGDAALAPVALDDDEVARSGGIAHGEQDRDLRERIGEAKASRTKRGDAPAHDDGAGADRPAHEIAGRDDAAGLGCERGEDAIHPRGLPRPGSRVW